MEKSDVSVINAILYRKDRYKLKTSEAIYEFIDKVAYFACAANIIMENYTASDGEPFYRELMGDFREYVKLYQRLAEKIVQERLTEKTADIILKSEINWLQQKSVKGFVEALSKAVKDNNIEKPLEYNMETRFIELRNRHEKTGFRARELLEILKEIRELEESDAGEEEK